MAGSAKFPAKADSPLPTPQSVIRQAEDTRRKLSVAYHGIGRTLTTREHYVGSADGADGFFGRWMDYVATGHGGNAGMRIRDPSDYLVSVLEVAGSTAGRNDILAMEEAWKRKLVSRSIGLNRN